MRKLSVLPVHPKERAAERYDVRFTRKQEQKFYEQLGGRNTIALPRHRCAVYFRRQWYLAVMAHCGTITTFLPLDALSAADKDRLRNDENYCRINDDQFNVGIAVERKEAFPAAVRPQRRKFRVPSVDDSELPADWNEAEILLQQ